MIKNKYFSKKELNYFFEDFEEKDPFKLMTFMVLSIGLYFITWTYYLNKKWCI